MRPRIFDCKVFFNLQRARLWLSAAGLFNYGGTTVVQLLVELVPGTIRVVAGRLTEFKPLRFSIHETNRRVSTQH